jgi:hypothetical protein
VLADIASLDLPVTIDELNRGTIESETFSRALQASRIADPVEVDNRWVIGTDMFKFVKRAQDLSALYLVIAEASTSEAERKKAENAAAQWSAYIKAAVNVSTINVATANFTSSAGSDFLYTAKLGDLRSNARQLAILGAQSDAAIPKALSQRLDAFEQSLAGGRLTTNELRLWSDVVGVPGGV